MIHTTIRECFLQCKNYFSSAAKIAQQLQHATMNKNDCTAKNQIQQLTTLWRRTLLILEKES